MQGGRAAGAGRGRISPHRNSEGGLELADRGPMGQPIAAQDGCNSGDIGLVDAVPAVGEKRLRRFGELGSFERLSHHGGPAPPAT